MNSRGFVLIFVIALLGVLSLLGALLIQVNKQQATLSQNYLTATKLNLLKYSGFQYVLREIQNHAITHDFTKQTLTIGPGTFVDQGDQVSFDIHDLNGRININDGLKAGGFESADDPTFNRYFARSLNPWPEDIYGNFDKEAPFRSGGNDIARSALINLRLRRILNAYGDVHRFVDQFYDDKLDHVYERRGRYVNVEPPKFSIHETRSSDGMRLTPMPFNKNTTLLNGQPSAQYNNGLGDRIIEVRPQTGFRHITEIKDIVNSWSQDPGISLSKEYLSTFSSLDFFHMVTQDLTTVSYEDTFYRIEDERKFGYYNGSVTADTGEFSPIHLDTWQVDLSDIFVKHSIPLININNASKEVLASLFYSLVNVSYPYEGATTIAPYAPPASGTNDLFSQHTATESMLSRPSIGVGPPVFVPEKKTRENGIDDAGRANHFMSMRDSLLLSYYLKEFYWRSNKLSLSFEELKEKLEWRAKEIGWPEYEKVHRVTSHTEQFRKLYYFSTFENQGHFDREYAARTLPHLFSCVRRIPSYLGAPAALCSPYILVQPEVAREQYLNGSPNQSGFIKIEDFVWKFLSAKLCFLPCGYYEVSLDSQIIVSQAQEPLKSKTTAHIKAYETIYLKTQKEFEAVTDTEKTHHDIKIGPEISPLMGGDVEPSSYIGSVGLKDFDDDMRLDGHMHFGLGLNPQIVMNFNPRDRAQGLLNSNFSYPQSPYRRKTYLWQDPHKNNIWQRSIPNEMKEGLYNSHIEGADKPFLSDTSQVDGRCDLSPFNGLSLTSINHGEFTDGIFNDSLYWRLSDWLTPGHPTGQDLGVGVAVFWFRIPTGYPLTHHVRHNHQVIESKKFTHILFSLNLWEAYQDFHGADPPFERSVTISTGLRLKETTFSEDDDDDDDDDDTGLQLFARYDNGNSPHSTLIEDSQHQFYGPQDLTESEYLFPSQTQYDFLGFFNRSLEPPIYSDYREQANRSVEASVAIPHQQQYCPGSWHRATMLWNLRWDEDKPIEPYDQLWIILNTSTEDQKITYHESKTTLPNTPAYDRQQSGADTGLVLPYDASMTLSLGEAHARRLTPYVTAYHDLEENFYRPFWRLNSCLDNIRIYMGSSQNSPATIDPKYLISYVEIPYGLLAHTSVTTMRYNVTQPGRHDNILPPSEHQEPQWVIDPQLPKQSRFLSFGARVYNPPNDFNNYSYVYLSGLTKDADVTFEHIPIAVDKYEQKLVYPTVRPMSYPYNPAIFVGNPKTDSNFRLSAQYMGYQPVFNSDPRDKDVNVDAILYGSSTRSQKGKYSTTIPWIKQISYRYAPPTDATVLYWSDN